MLFPITLILWFISSVRLIYGINVVSTEESGGRDFLGSLNENSAELALKLVRAQWMFETNNTANAKNELIQLTSEAIKKIRVRFQKVLSSYPWQSFSNPDLRRQLKFFSEIGTLALPEEEYNQFEKIISDLNIVQQNTTICDYYNRAKCNLFYSDIKQKMEISQNSEELSYLWTEWRKATEPKLKKLLENYVKLCNQAAVLNNYRNYREYSLRNIESVDVKQEMKTLWEDIKPLYSQMHAYVRRKLRDTYGEKIIPRKGPIPIYLLGNIWSERLWSQKMVPYPEQDNFDFTSAMISQGFTPECVRKAAENFFLSMNFSVPSNIWVNTPGKSSITSTENCHPKIFNFHSGDIRIKHCEKISLKDYLEDIRLLTKAEYVLQYKDQPFIYQTPADPGLEEAMSSMLTMSASTFNNLKKLNLYKGELTEKIRLNRLFKLALEKLTSLAFLLVQEFWRWDVYNGRPLEETANTVNDLREKFQGISTFTKELTFDPGGIGSAFSKLSLAHYYLGNFLQFQLYESLCKMSKTPLQESDITECNLYKNVDAGDALRKMMSLGSSKTLTETFSSVLGINKINSNSILKYFDPLMKWLEKENEITGEFVGWESERRKDSKNPTKIRRKRSLDDYPSELKDEDSDITTSIEPDRFQRHFYKRSENNQDYPEANVRERKDLGYYQNKNSAATVCVSDKQRPGREANERAGRSFSTKNRRSSITKYNSNKHSRQIALEENQTGENSQEHKKVNTRNVKHNSGFETLEKTYVNMRTHESNGGESTQEKRSYDLGGESDEDFASNIASKEDTYQNAFDYNRMKSADGKGDEEGKRANKLWSVKSYLTESANIISPEPSLDKKDDLDISRVVEEKSIGKKEASRGESNVMLGKEMANDPTKRRLFQSGEDGLKRLTVDMPSLQAILQKADLNGYQPRQIISISPHMSESKDRNDISPVYSQSKFNSNGQYANFFLKYTPPSDSQQYKERKEFRDGNMESKGKLPYIIILGQSPPETKENFQAKGTNFREVKKESLTHTNSNTDEKKTSDKRSRESDHIYVVPIDLESIHHNLIKTNHYAENEHEAGHDPNTERDRESEENLRIEDDSKTDDNSDFYKSEKESPSGLIISWNNDKNRKIVKRSKREHKKDPGEDKMKTVRIAPVKDTFLEGLLEKSLDRDNADDRNVKILIHDGQLDPDMTSSPNNPAESLSRMDETDPLQQPPSSLSSLASSVLSSLSPKAFSQLAKANNQHQDLDMEEDNIRENSNALSFVGKKKPIKLHTEDIKPLLDADQAAKGEESCCKKIILSPCPSRGPPCPPPPLCPCSPPCPCPCPPPPCPPMPPCPDNCNGKSFEFNSNGCCKQENDMNNKRPCECSLVNCQFKITKSKKPHERLTIMIYDRINPPAELPEPYDALAVISEILQRIQCCPPKPTCQLTEEDPDYPANDNSDQLKGDSNPSQDDKAQEMSGEIPVFGSDTPEEEESDNNPQLQQMPNSPNSVEEDKYLPKEKATPALDQLTVFNKEKLKPVFFELRKIDDLIKKRSQKE